MAGIIAIAVLVGTLFASKLAEIKEDRAEMRRIEARYMVPPCDQDNCGKSPQ